MHDISNIEFDVVWSIITDHGHKPTLCGVYFLEDLAAYLVVLHGYALLVDTRTSSIRRNIQATDADPSMDNVSAGVSYRSDTRTLFFADGNGKSSSLKI